MVAEGFPAGLAPPVPLVLAKAVPRIPAPGALPGGCLYEPKWDGFRMAMFVGPAGTTLWSRQGKDLTRYFPELAAAATEQIPSGVVLDGEAVLWSQGRLDFDVLQRRLTTSKAQLASLVRESPASFAAFDLLAVAGRDIRGVPLAGRRELLEALAAHWSPPLNLSPATTDPEVAQTWFEEMPGVGVEGLVIKGAGQNYEGGLRQWRKVKHREVLDVVCGAVIGSRTEPTAIVAGLPIDGQLRIVGRSSVLSSKTARELGRYLRPAPAGHPWPKQISPGTLDRFSKDKGPISLTLVEPVVVEVSADVAWSGRSFRHSLRFQRVRPELSPAAVELPESFQPSS